VRILDSILFVLLLVGNALSLPVWWWLFGAPITQLLKRRAGKPPPSRLT
jgi:hypothetical protein